MLADHPRQIGLSPYQFSWNNPILYNDPNGECPDCWEFLKGVGRGIGSGAVGTWNFATSDAWKSTGNLLLGAAAMGPTGNAGNLYAVDAALGTNTVDAVGALSGAVDNAVAKVQSGDPGAIGEVVGGAAWAGVEALAGSKGAGLLSKSGNLGKISKFSPINPGPLPESVANTFRSATYAEGVSDGAVTLYRAYGGSAGEVSSYWSRTKPSGPVQAIIDSALDPAWGNTATRTSSITLPQGTRFYEGLAAPQRGLVGGGNQVYIPRVNPSWLNK